jgi:hypothetical protein
VLRAWWLGYQRPGGYYVPVIQLRRENPIEFAVKLPDHPERLGLENPYPSLKSWWHAPSRQWTWAIPTTADIPDIRLAIELSRRFQPDSGPMPPPLDEAPPDSEDTIVRGDVQAAASGVEASNTLADQPGLQ